jgi:hypothetical protein
MADSSDEIRGIEDIPEHEADELRDMVRRVINKYIDDIVVDVYRQHNRSFSSTAMATRMEELTQEELEALHEEGMEEFLGGRELDQLDQVEQDEAHRYMGLYALIALSVRYPWVMARVRRSSDEEQG